MRSLHIDLFSGIGGFTLAFEAAGFETILFCESEHDRQRDLRHHWPSVPIVGDINDIEGICRVVEDARRAGPSHIGWEIHNGEELSTAGGAGASSEDAYGTLANAELPRRGQEHCDVRRIPGANSIQGRQEVPDGYERSRQNPLILTAGVPCQPASAAGKRKGSADDRWLWPQTIRLVERLRPDWCVFENPLGIASLAQPAAIPGVDIERLRDVPGRTICEILTAIRILGYELPTDRDGVPWIPVVPAAGVGAFHGRDRLWIIARRRDVANSELSESARYSDTSGKTLPLLGNADSKQCGTSGQNNGFGETGIYRNASVCPLPNWSDANLEQGQDGKWRAVKPGLRLLANGIPRRTSKLRGFGNSIAPAVAYQIAKAIREQIG